MPSGRGSVADPESGDRTSPPAAARTPGKRRAARGQTIYPRKRALAACEACRQRKTKCDSHRPTCGACAELDIECIFRSSASDHSTYDRASLEILDRINYVAGLIEAQGATHYNTAVGDSPLAEITNSEATQSQGHGSSLFPLSTSDSAKGQKDAETREFLDSLEINGRGPSLCEDILEWPVFGGTFNRTRIETLIFNPSQASCENATHTSNSQYRHGLIHSRDPVHGTRSIRGINEEHAPSLVERFLINVHIKNPVLEPDDARRKARHIAESGFSWDADSCLLLIICALATLSSDFTTEPVTAELVDEPNPTTSLVDAEDCATAEAYYTAARKRLGLLNYGISAAQCYFFTGVYEMYSLWPVKAWGSFSRACDILQIYFRSHQHEPALSVSGGLVGRLYWSCLKSECEIRMEVNLPPSGLAKVAYSDVFPSPPSGSPGPVEEFHASPSSTSSEHPFLERVWSYYLSEIAVRKIGNRIMNCFYQDDATAWLSVPLHRMIRIAAELELQLTQWFENLPVTLQTSSAESPNPDAQIRVTQELQFVLQARLSDFREKLYRPFLYLAIHLPPTDPRQQTLTPYLHRCVDACLSFLHRGTPRHRHHGTWYENRGMFLKSLLLVAVAKSGRMQMPPSWRDGPDLCIAGLRFWEGEAPDLRAARDALCSILAEIQSANY